MKYLFATFAVVAVLVAHPAFAHHSFARFYFEDQTVSIEGELLEFTLRSPHAWVYIMTADKDGEMHLVAAEWANANRLGRQGVTEETLKPGDRVVVTGSPGRDPSENKLHLKGITRLSDGWHWARN
jgi:hypothetical protein